MPFTMCCTCISYPATICWTICGVFLHNLHEYLMWYIAASMDLVLSTCSYAMINVSVQCFLLLRLTSLVVFHYVSYLSYLWCNSLRAFLYYGISSAWSFLNIYKCLHIHSIIIGVVVLTYLTNASDFIQNSGFHTHQAPPALFLAGVQSLGVRLGVEICVEFPSFNMSSLLVFLLAIHRAYTFIDGFCSSHWVGFSGFVLFFVG